MKITIINQHTLNFGDDLAGISAIKYMKEQFGKDTIFSIFYRTEGKIDFKDDKIKNFDGISMKKIGVGNILSFLFFSFFGKKTSKNKYLNLYLNEVNSSDIVFISPCGANIGIYKDWAFLISIIISIRLKKRPVFHNNTIGKSGHILFDKIASYYLKYCDLYVREINSLKYLESKNLFSIRGVDSAFMFRNSEYKTIDDQYILFIPTRMDNWHPDFKNFSVEEIMESRIIRPMISFAKEKHLKIFILPHLYGETNESKLLESYRKIIVSSGIDDINVDILECSSCYEYDSYISQAKFVVSMRYHGVVMSIKNRTPFLSLAYENKMAEVCAYSCLPEFNIWLKELKNEKIDFEEIIFKFDLSKNKIPTDLSDKAKLCIDQTFFKFQNH